MFQLNIVSSLEILDALACVLIAAAATCRARSLGANLCGAVILGCLCGLLVPLVREAVLRGSLGSGLILRSMSVIAILGALSGVAFLAIFRTHAHITFFWLDSAGFGLACSLCALLAVMNLGIAGGLALGLVCGLCPGLLRDVALGDTAMLVEKNWYAGVAFLGCVFALFVDALLFVGLEVERHVEWGVIWGALATVALRRWKGYGQLG